MERSEGKVPQEEMDEYEREPDQEDAELNRPNMEDEETNPDRFISLLGNPGRFQMLQFVLLSSMFIACSMNDLVPIFYDFEPHSVGCVAPTPAIPEKFVTLAPENHTELDDVYKDWWLEEEKCQRVCPTKNVEYTFHGGEWSVLAEMNLICDRRYLIALATTLYFVGCAIGGPLFGWLADRFGRRPSLFLANLLYTAFNVGLVFARDYVTFVILRVGSGFARQIFVSGVGITSAAVGETTANTGLQATFLVLMLEWTHPNQRSRIGAATQFFYVIGVLLLALVAYFLRTWHHIQIAIACANVAVVSFYWIAPESIQWLLCSGKVNQAEDNARQVAKFNNIELHKEDWGLLHSLAESHKRCEGVKDDKQYTMMDLFKSVKVALITLLSCYIWFVAAFGYMGISYMISSLSENPYANLAIAGALEAIPTALTIPLVSRFGRRYPMAGFFTSATVFLICAGSLPVSQEVQGYLALLGRMSVVGSFSIIYVWATEIFPTSIRNAGFGILSFAFMVGGMAAPPVVELKDRFEGSLAIPITVIGCATGLAAAAALILPETSKHDYPETIEDVQALPYGISCRKKRRRDEDDQESPQK